MLRPVWLGLYHQGACVPPWRRLHGAWPLRTMPPSIPPDWDIPFRELAQQHRVISKIETELLILSMTFTGTALILAARGFLSWHPIVLQYTIRKEVTYMSTTPTDPEAR